MAAKKPVVPGGIRRSLITTKYGGLYRITDNRFPWARLSKLGKNDGEQVE
jgi:hypothetical protein